MTLCERGRELDRPTLHWYHPPAGRIPLHFFPAPGIACTAEVRRCEAVILEILCEQWIRDAGKIEAARGFVNTEDLARRYAERVGDLDPVEVHTIFTYVWTLHKEMRREAASHGLDVAPKLIENKRGTGYRIASCGLSILRAHREHTVWC